MDRRRFLSHSGLAASLATLPVTLVDLAFAKPTENFTFAYISDAHIEHVEGSRFVRNWDQGLARAVAEVNLLTPKPDFVVFGGDLANLGRIPELEHGAELLAKLGPKLHCVLGERDYYLDLGAHWSRLFGQQYYSFDHKGVHFVVLNSVLTYDDWTFNRWRTAEQRMREMAAFDSPNGSPFLVGAEQRKWLTRDLSRLAPTTPIVVFSHSPLQKIHKAWNFWTDDAEDVHALLLPFERVCVLYGHVHQIQHNQIDSISFNSVMATAWTWPYPHDYYAQSAGLLLPKLTVEMSNGAGFCERNATGWQTIDIHTGRMSASYNHFNNTSRLVTLDQNKGHPQAIV